MKLITEIIHNQGFQIEESGGVKQLYIEGVFAQSEIVNNNNRKYPKSTLLREVNKYVDEKVSTSMAMGELNHPSHPHVNIERATHRTVSLEESGNDFIGKALVLNTPMGQIVKGVIEGGGVVAISSRALGSIKNNVVQEDLMLKTFDIVSDPGAPSAFMNGIMEGVEYEFMDNQLVKKKVEEIQNNVHKVSANNINEEMIKGWNEIINIAKGHK